MNQDYMPQTGRGLSDLGMILAGRTSLPEIGQEEASFYVAPTKKTQKTPRKKRLVYATLQELMELTKTRKVFNLMVERAKQEGWSFAG